MQILNQEAIEGQPINFLLKKNTNFASDVFKLASGTVFAQLIVILAAPLLTRLYTPEAFGVIALFTSITSILVVVACMRYELAIMLPKSDKEAANLLGLSLGFVVLVSILTVPFIFWGQKALLRWLNAPNLLPYLWLISPAVFIGGVFLAFSYWNSRSKRFGRISIARMANSALTTTAQLSAGYAGYATAGSLIGANIAGQTVAATILGIQIWQSESKLFRKDIRLDYVIEGAKRYRKFPIVDIWGALLNNISWKSPALLLSAFFSQTAVGYYALAFQLIHLPLSIIGAALEQVFFQRISEMKVNGKELADHTEKVYQRLVALCLFPCFLLSITGREFFSIIFGSRWSEAGVYAQILSIWMFWWFISFPLSSIFTVRERQGSVFIFQLTIFCSRIVSLLLGGFFKNVYLGLWLFATSSAIAYGRLAFWNLSMVGISLKTGFMIFFRYLIYSIPAMGFLLLLKIFRVEPIWVICVATVELIVYYIIIIRSDRQLYQCIYSSIPLLRRNHAY